ncbi:MAG: hypothetical protein WD042_06535 [Phycisphaeraceae bacterium]
MPVQREFSRYRQLLSPLALRGLEAAAARRSDNVKMAESVALAVPAATLLLRDDPAEHKPLIAAMRHLAELGAEAAKQDWAHIPWHLVVPLRDDSGEIRPFYHPLALHLNLAAFGRCYESLSMEDWGAIENAIPDAVSVTRCIETYADTTPEGDRLTLVLWYALCLQDQAIALGRDIDLELTDAVVHSALAQPGPGGTLQRHDPELSLDAWTYDELVGLHALANLALGRRNPTWLARVQEIAAWHLENTQPDNTTTQPWALLAFLASPQTHSFADQQIHDATTHATGDAPVVNTLTALLLADAAAGLERLEACSL